jgi:hypothetical protein
MVGTKLPAINAERMHNLYDELKVLGLGTNVESNLPSISAGSVTV